MPEKYGDWILRSEVARRLGLTTRSVDRAIKAKKLRAAKRETVGRRPLVVIHPADVQAVEAEMLGNLRVAAEGDAPKRFMSLVDAAAHCGLPEAALRRLIVDGRLPALEVGGVFFIRKKNIDAL